MAEGMNERRVWDRKWNGGVKGTKEEKENKNI